MSRQKNLPFDNDAERALIGALIMSEQARATVIDDLMLRPDELYSIPNQEIYAAICRVKFDGGGKLDLVTLSAKLETMGAASVDAGDHLLQELMDATPTISNCAAYVARIRDMAVRRRMILFAAEVNGMAMDPTVAVGRVVESATDGLASVVLSAEEAEGEVAGLYAGPSQMVPSGDIDDINPWVVPRFLRSGESCLVVAGPGSGKSAILRQFAYCVMNNIHPLTAARLSIEPRRALLVELEAPKHSVFAFGQRLKWDLHRRLGVQQSEILEPATWHRKGGIDIRNPVDRAAFISVLRKTRPDLVCIGPLKYLFSPRPGELADQTAVEVQKILGGLQERFGFALLVEAHANKSDKLQPSGSERWVDWPDLGFAMSTAEDLFRASAAATFDVIPFRIPRNDLASTPPKLLRNMKHSLPWFVDAMTEIAVNAALREDGMLDESGPPPPVQHHAYPV